MNGWAGWVRNELLQPMPRTRGPVGRRAVHALATRARRSRKDVHKAGRAAVGERELVQFELVN
jgi:hypothetical protein